MAAKKKNAGRRSIRKTKKAYRADEKFFRHIARAKHPIPTWETSGLKRKKKGPRKNPIPAGKALAFSSKAAARSYAKKNGITGYRILRATKPR